MLALLRALLLAALVTAAVAAPATAATVSVEDGVLRYVAEPGESNEVDIGSDQDVEGLVYVYEYAADVTPGSGCVPAPDPIGLAFGVVFLVFNCVGVDSVEIELGDESDYGGAFTDPQPATVSGGEGDDFIYGSYGDDALDGGPGSDEMIGGPGSDKVTGGEGNDTLDGDYIAVSIDDEEERAEEASEGGPDVVDGGDGDDVLRGGIGTDTLIGGGGLDTADYGARADANTITLDGQANDGRAGENDALAADVEAVLAGGGADALTGNDGPNVLTGGAGDDVIAAGGGEDRVAAGDGKDTVDVRDGGLDSVECGDGLPDRVTADAADITDGACELVDKPGGTGGAGTKVKPRALKLRIVDVRPGRRGIVRLRGRLVVADATARGTCAGTAVRLTVRSGRRRQVIDVPMDSACRFSAAVPIPVARRSRVSARAAFAGTAQLQGLFSRVAKAR